MPRQTYQHLGMQIRENHEPPDDGVGDHYISWKWQDQNGRGRFLNAYGTSEGEARGKISRDFERLHEQTLQHRENAGQPNPFKHVKAIRQAIRSRVKSIPVPRGDPESHQIYADYLEDNKQDELAQRHREYANTYQNTFNNLSRHIQDISQDTNTSDGYSYRTVPSHHPGYSYGLTGSGRYIIIAHAVPTEDENTRHHQTYLQKRAAINKPNYLRAKLHRYLQHEDSLLHTLRPPTAEDNTGQTGQHSLRQTKTIRSLVKSTGQWQSRQEKETPEQTNERVNREHFGGGHVVLRLHGRDRVYHTPKQAGRLDLPSEALADIYGEEAGHVVMGHGSHHGGHVHVDLPEESHQGTHHENYGKRPPYENLSFSRFRHLGREVVEHHFNDTQPDEHNNYNHRIQWSIYHPVHKDVMYSASGTGKTEREARSQANARYHQLHESL